MRVAHGRRLAGDHFATDRSKRDSPAVVQFMSPPCTDVLCRAEAARPPLSRIAVVSCSVRVVCVAAGYPYSPSCTALGQKRVARQLVTVSVAH